ETFKTFYGLETLLALCLTSREETYHHWKVFTDKNNGVCIKFRRDQFEATMRASNVHVREMTYLTIDELDPSKYRAEDLPFLKRYGFGDEGEFRAVFASKENVKGPKRIKIDLGMIDSISMNPWMHRSVFDSVKRTIESLH